VKEYLLVMVASFLAGATNAVAGGGTLITFPVLVWVGLDPLSANITNTVALWVGPLLGAYAFREYVKLGKEYLRRLLLPTLLGSLLGAYLLVNTSQETFKSLVPFLILLATILVAVNDKVVSFIQRYLRRGSLPFALFIQFIASLYGGYFGAGTGIIMLASLGIIGIADIHLANGIKNLLGMTINALASGYFVFSGHVFWNYVLVMMLGFALGGYTGAKLSLIFDRKKVRLFVVLWGLFLSLFFFVKEVL